MRWMLFSVLLMISGCVTKQSAPVRDNLDAPVTPQQTPVPKTAKSEPCGFVSGTSAVPVYACSHDYLQRYMQWAQVTPWAQRREQIERDDGQTLLSTLHSMIASSPADTPYKDRLRAIKQIPALEDKISQANWQWLSVFVVHPSEKILALQSEVSLLEKQLEKQQEQRVLLEQQVREQAQKIQALLQIEENLRDDEGR